MSNKPLQIAIFIVITCLSLISLAKGNYISPHSYFVGRANELSDINKKLKEDGRAVVFGKSGTGKTQLIRKYIKEHNDKYDYIWVFNSADNLARQEDEFVKYVSIKEKESFIDKESALKYFTKKNGIVLFVYDNIEVTPSKGAMIAYKESLVNNNKNIKYLFSSQKKLSSSFIEVNNLKKSEVIDLLEKTTKRPIDPKKIIQATKGHPLLTYRFIRNINNNKFLSEEEVYQNFSSEFSNSFKAYVFSLKSKLSTESFDCLNKVALINNANLDKQEIVFFCGKKHGIKSLIEIQQYNVLDEQIAENGTFKGFELHNMIKNKLIDLSNKYLTKTQILEAIQKVNDLFIQDADQLDKILSSYPNILGHIESLQSKASSYGISKVDLFELVSNLAMLYLYYADYNTARMQIDWLRKSFNQSNLSDDLLKVLAYSYISEGVLEDFQSGDAIKAEKAFLKAINIYDTIKSPPLEGVYMAITQLAQTYVYINEFDKAQTLLSKAKDMLDKKQKVPLDKAIYYFLMSKLQYEERNFSSASKTISEGLNKLKDRPDNHFKAPLYSLQADILLEDGKPQEALKVAIKALEDTKTTLQIEGEVLARARLTYANCLLETDKDVSIAISELEKARMGLEKDRGVQDIKTSDDDDLAFSYFIEYRAMMKKQNKKEALDSLIKAINIYENRYKRNCNTPKMKKLYQKAVTLSEKLEDMFIHKLYSKKLSRNFSD